VNPPAARLAARTPASDARPRCSRLTMPPSPRENSSNPPHSDPAMPSALVIADASATSP